jgi:DMSO/TMAO reductase YedYZ molybdopterin-dependent catalytic subunit
MKKASILSRREFISIAGGAVVQIGLPGFFVKLTHAETQAAAVALRKDGRPRIPPGQTAVKALYNMGGAAGPGRVAKWRLKVAGELKRQTVFSYEDLMKLPQVDRVCDVHCVTGWTLLDAHWRGIRLTSIMKAVGVTKSAGFVIFESPSGYTSNIPMAEARKENVILAHTFMGDPLPEENGAPLRAIVPDRYFYKSAKWIEGIKLSAQNELGYWEKGGYSNSADPWQEERYK